MIASFMTEISLLSLIRRTKAVMSFILHGPSYKHPHEQIHRQIGEEPSVWREGERGEVTLMEKKECRLWLREGTIHYAVCKPKPEAREI